MESMRKNTEGVWEYSNVVASKEGFNSTLKTANKYLDADIKLNVEVTEGTVLAPETINVTATPGAGTVNVTPGTGVNLLTEAPTEGYSISAEGYGHVDATATYKAEVTKSGWLDEKEYNASGEKGVDSEKANKTVYLNKAKLTTTEGQASATIGATGTPLSEEETQYKINLSGQGTFSAAATVSEGYTEGDNKNINGNVSIADKEIYIKDGDITTADDEKSSTTEITTTLKKADSSKYSVKATSNASTKVAVTATEGYITAEDSTSHTMTVGSEDTIYLAEGDVTLEASASVNADVTTTLKTVENSKFAVTATGSGLYSANATVAEGYVVAADSETEGGSVEVTDKTVYLEEAELSEKSKAGSVTATATPEGFVASESPTKYKVTASGAGSYTTVVNVSEGYTESADKEVTGEVTVTPKDLYISEARLSNSVTDEDSYPTVKGPTLISDKYLYIDGGYIERQKIALKDLVPDGSNVKGYKSLMHNSVVAYDNDGVEITGTMGDLNATLNDATISLSGEVVGTNYVISGSDSLTPVVTNQGAYGTYVVEIYDEEGKKTGEETKNIGNIQSGTVSASLSIPVYQGELEI